MLCKLLLLLHYFGSEGVLYSLYGHAQHTCLKYVYVIQRPNKQGVQARSQGNENKHEDQMNKIQVNTTDVNNTGHTKQIRYINCKQ